jgi:predicted N-acetyltransferase YhbS
VPEIRPLDLSPQGLERTAKLLRVVFPEARHIDAGYLERLYLGNPLGETSGLCAWQAGELVAHYLMIPIRARIFGEVERGIWPFQLATHPDHRDRGLFGHFVASSHELCRERGYTFFSGVGNAKSTPIYVSKFGYQRIRQLDVKVGLGNAPPPGDPTVLDLVRLWDEAGVAWRCGLPAAPYRTTRRGGWTHLYATGPCGLPVEVGAFPEAMAPHDLPRLGAARALRLWIGVDPTRDWSRSLYRDVPKRLWPSPLHLLFHDLTEQGRRFDPARVRYEAFDFDAY